MAVLVSSDVHGQTREGYDGVLHVVRDSIKAAPGFIMHCAYPSDGKWVLYEVWDSKQQADRWFAATVVPNLPKGIHPKRNYQELHSLVTKVEEN